ncbi:MAG: MXAN_6640 family putative metalloprotease [Candidatus Latescibacterota bacterium]|jgi:hypothetical protein
MRRSLLLFLCLAAPVGARTLIEQAYEAGTLDLETALLYQVQSLRDQEAIPPRYREEPARPFCGTPILVQAMQAVGQLGPDYGQRLAKILTRPSAERQVLSPSGHFRIHYDLRGINTVEATDLDANGRPDYVDEVAATLDQTWALQVDSLRFGEPPSDGVLGGGPEYDVHLVELGRVRAYGYTYPETSGATTYSYLELDNNYTDAIYAQTRGRDALHVTVAHEFSHALQFGYYQGSDGIWWQEATSTWMEEVAYPEVDDYLQYVSSFLLEPERSLDSGSRLTSTDFHVYGAALFAHFLQHRYERDLIRRLWAEIAARANAHLEHFDRVLRTVTSGGLGTATAEFSVWNYLTGNRHRDGYYPEGEKYPAAKRVELSVDAVAPKTVVEHDGTVDHLGSAYLSLEPRLLGGGVTLEFTADRGEWQAQLLLLDRDGIKVLPWTGSSAVVPSWDQYDNVVLVLTETDLTGVSFGYSASITYDPDLFDAPPPDAFALRESFPNPFRPDLGGLATIPFDLHEPSLTNRLAIYGSDGQLVWRRELGERSARTHLETWDGCNQDGQPVASGIYYYVLETDQSRAAKSLAVVRGGDE